MLSRRQLFLALFLLLVVAIGIGIRHLPTWSWIVQHEISLRETVRQNPWRSFGLGTLVYALVSLIPGTSGKSVLFGWLFGFWTALVIVEIGLTTAAVISFSFSRFAIRQMVQEKWQSRLQLLSARFESDGVFYLLLLRLAHAPFTFVNYSAGATRVPLTGFTWTTALGLLPGTAVFTFAGTRIPTLTSLAEHGVIELVDVPLILVLAATFVLPILLRYFIRTISRRKAAASVQG